MSCYNRPFYPLQDLDNRGHVIILPFELAHSPGGKKGVRRQQVTTFTGSLSTTLIYMEVNIFVLKDSIIVYLMNICLNISTKT